MKRSSVVELIAAWGKPEILQDVYSNNYKEWADNLLYTLETEIGIVPPKHINKNYNGWQSEYSGISQYINAWEDEDEKK